MNKNVIFRLARGVLGAGLVVTYILAVASAVSTQIIPLPYVIAATVMGAVVVILLCMALFRTRVSKGVRIVASIIALLMTVGNLYAFSVGSATTSFLNSFEEGEYSEIEYSIIAEKSRDIALSPHSTQQVGLLSTNQYSDLVKTEVSEKTQADYKEFHELTSLTTALDTGDTDVTTLRSSYLPLLEDNYQSFYSNIEVLATFTIKVENDAKPASRDVSQPFVMYISGIDTGGQITSVSRSDVNILAVVNPKTHKILLVNTPRDYYVQLHGTTGARDKLTHAGIYGVDTSKNTMEDLYDVPIDYYLRINFASLTKLVDTIGGVNVYSEHTFKSESYEFTKGYNDVDGKQALDFARTRKAFENGDRTRGENQQRVIEAIIHKLNSPDMLVNYQSIMKSLEGTFQTNANSEDIAAIIQQQMNSLKGWDVKSISVDGTGTKAPTYSMGATELYVMEPNMQSVESAKQAIDETLAQ